MTNNKQTPRLPKKDRMTATTYPPPGLHPPQQLPPLMTRHLALDVYDMLHVFGNEPISFFAWRTRFRSPFCEPRCSLATDSRAWGRLNARMCLYCVPHELVLKVVDESPAEFPQPHLRFLPGARELVNKTLNIRNARRAKNEGAKARGEREAREARAAQVGAA